jgi:hypothetical protein
VDSLHVVKEVVATRKAVTRHSSLTVPEVAQVWPRTVTVHTVRLALVAEKACSRRELHTNAGLLVATERLEVRVHVLARNSLDTYYMIGRTVWNILVVALQSSWLVAASGLALLGAVVLAILVWCLLVQWVAAGNLCALLLELGVSGLRLRECVFVSV